MCAPKGESWSQGLLAETVETVHKNRDVSQRHASFGEESLEEIDANMSSFSGTGRVTNSIRLESVDYFGISEYFSDNFDGEATKLVGCCKLSLYANESCDEHAVGFSAVIEITRHVCRVFGLWEGCY